jgi:ribonuclease BN (tRNA processing enzyme)
MDKNGSGEGIRIDFIGDSGLFSRRGKGISYRITVKNSDYLFDLGSSVFHALGPENIGHVRGIFATHSHEDHRRWFTDLALFTHYFPHIQSRVRLIATETIHEEWEKNSKAALERSLSSDQKHIVEVAYETFVDRVLVGPKALYRIAPVRPRGAKEGWTWRVVDSAGEVVSPTKAKVVIHPQANRPRMLFKDKEVNAWVEPETFYVFSDRRFYEAEQNAYVDEDAGLTVRPLKGPCWHGPPTFGFEFRTANERVLFTSDTVYDLDLWLMLCEEHHAQQLDVTQRQFNSAPIVYGDINQCIEYKWSRERYEEAVGAYEGGIVVHDVDYDGSVVHTSYSKLAASGHRNLLLTHSPDTFVSQIPLAQEGKVFRVIRDELFEEVQRQGTTRLHPYDADLFVKRFSDFYVGFQSPDGSCRLIARKGRLDVATAEPTDATVIGRYDLYSDVNGQYFPVLDDPTRERYESRLDGQVEKVTKTPNGSQGVIVRDLREQIERKQRQVKG